MENITKFKGSPVLVKLSNKKRLSVWFIPVEEDPFMINVIYFNTNSGTITHECLITKLDMETRINSCIKSGYKLADG
jgi:hypothetical protein